MKLSRHRWSSSGACFICYNWWLKVWTDELPEIISTELYGVSDRVDYMCSISLHPFFIVRGKGETL